MSCFTKTELENPKFPAVTSRFRKIKTTEGEAEAGVLLWAGGRAVYVLPPAKGFDNRQ